MAQDKEFIGEHYFNMDSKGRVTLPARFRDDLGEGFYVTKGTNRCLAVYDKESWAKFKAMLQSFPATDQTASYVRRVIMAGANNPEPDKQGKILLSLSHREYAGLVKEVAIIGVDDHIEIWDKARWIEYTSRAESLEGAMAGLNELEKSKWLNSTM